MHSILTCQTYQFIPKIFYRHVLKVQIQKTAGTISANIQIVVLSISIFSQMMTQTTQVPAKWFKWEDLNGHTTKHQKSGTVFELYTYTKTVVDAFLPHCFIKRKQAEQYELDKVQAQKENSNVVVLQMDYAENYKCRAQDEVQSAHWNQDQVTHYTSVFWFRNQIIPHVIKSDTRQHNKSTVVPFTDQILSNTPHEGKHIKIWTDGPASHFKNQYVMASMPMLSAKHHVKLSWNFSATSHDKGPIDGVGATLK